MGCVVRFEGFSIVTVVLRLALLQEFWRSYPPTALMNLYLMRHANAGVPRDNPLLDAKRSLVKEGKQQCMLMAGVLAALKVQIDVIIASPLKRSMQSAQFVGNGDWV